MSGPHGVCTVSRLNHRPLPASPALPGPRYVAARARRIASIELSCVPHPRRHHTIDVVSLRRPLDPDSVVIFSRSLCRSLLLLLFFIFWISCCFALLVVERTQGETLVDSLRHRTATCTRRVSLALAFHALRAASCRRCLGLSLSARAEKAFHRPHAILLHHT